jgi:hypothetical protein
VAKLWRSAWGVADAGRPSRARARSIASCTRRGDSAPPARPETTGQSRAISSGQSAHIAATAARAAGSTGTSRSLPPLPVMRRLSGKLVIGAGQRPAPRISATRSHKAASPPPDRAPAIQSSRASVPTSSSTARAAFRPNRARQLAPIARAAQRQNGRGIGAGTVGDPAGERLDTADNRRASAA